MPLLAMLLNGCSSIYYLYQAGKGQLALLNRGRPIEKVIQDPTTDPRLADLLSRIAGIREFCDRSGLKQTPNYREYVNLDRDAVVYVVTVSEPLEFKVKIFSFPIAGSFNYIGWFSQDDAIDFARKFEAEGKDVDVRGASAYSTLGWFKDPLLSSMIAMDHGVVQTGALADLVNVLIHESVHATLYIDHQSYFNEGLAVFVADQLTHRYFESKQMTDSVEWKNYLLQKDRGQKVRQRLMNAYADLQLIYDSTDDASVKLKKKKDYLAALQKETGIKRPITNATLIQVKTYDDSDHGFQELLDSKKGDLSAFFTELTRLKTTDFEKEHDPEFQVMRLIRKK